MRIGLLTYFWEDNPGQFFQALATVGVLRKTFPDAEIEIPDVRPWDRRKRFWGYRDMAFRPWRNVARQGRRTRYNKGRLQLPIRGPKAVTNDPAAAVREIGKRGYDLLVIGSDTTLYLWGNGRYKDNLPPPYWLADLPNVPRVMLASSGHTDRYEDLTEQQRSIMSRAVKDFCFMAVRDPLTMNMLTKLGPREGTPLRVVPDPTFTYEIDTAPARMLAERKKIRRKRPLCGLNLPTVTPFTKKLVELLRRHFDVVALSPCYPGCKRLVVGPFEWSGIFSQFDLCVTASFHEAVFCLKLGTPVFSVEGAPYRFDPHSGKSKIYFLLEEFGLVDQNFVNPYRSAATAEKICDRIAGMWRSFDRQAVVDHAKTLRQRYLDAAADMREVVVNQIG